MSQKATIHIETHDAAGTSTEWTVTGEVRFANPYDSNDCDDIEIESVVAGSVDLSWDDFVAEHGSVALRDKWEQALRMEALECYQGPSDEETWARNASCAGVAAAAWNGR